MEPSTKETLIAAPIDWPVSDHLALRTRDGTVLTEADRTEAVVEPLPGTKTLRAVHIESQSSVDYV